MKLQKYPSIALRALETFGGRAQKSVFFLFLAAARNEIMDYRLALH